MRRKVPFRRISGLIALALLLAWALGACNGEPTSTSVPPTEVVVADTATPVPPTNTPVPPTDTPLPPTDTPLPPTDTPVPPTDTPAPTPTEDIQQAAALLQQATEQATAGDLQGTVETCTEVVDMTQDPQLLMAAYFLRGAAYSDLGEYDLAIADMLESEQLGNTDPSFLNVLCWTYSLAERAEEGLPYCEAAVAADASVGNLDSRGLAYGLLGQTDEAIADFQVVVDGLADAAEPQMVAMRVQRTLWLEALQAGQDPFTSEEMAVLRGEVTPTPIPPTPTPAPTEPAATKAPVSKATPTAKPKGGKILMTSNRDSWDDIYIMNDDGSGLKKLTTMGKCYDATFMPDGKTIYFEHGDDLWKMNADGSGQTNLTNTTDNLEDFPVVAPDGSRIAYTFGWPGGFEIYTMKPDGTDAKPITSRNLDITPSWSPDSQRIAFARATNTWSIWVVNRDGSGARQVTPFGPERWAISPVFSPDGKQIAFSTIANDTAWEIWVINVDGTNPHRVQGAVGSDRNNSTNIVDWKKGQFLIAGWEGSWKPYYVPQAGGAPQQMLTGDKDDKPSDWWTP